MSAATVVAEAFGEGACLYTAVLGLPSAGAEVTAAQLRKAYYKRALLYHPDKQNGKPDDEVAQAKSKFQAVSVAYSVLSNPETRAEYDETGELVDDEEGAGGDKSGADAWKEYFSGIFGKVTTDDIDKFEAKYKCSEEEEADVIKYYKAFKGNLDKMLECVMLSKDIDKKRWVEDYIEPAIERGDVKRYDALKQTMGSGNDNDEEMDDEETDPDETETEDDSEEEKKAQPRVKKSKSSKKKDPPKKRKEQTKHKKKSGRKTESGGGADADLIAAIRGNAVARSGRSFDAMMAGLEERYSDGSGGKKKTKKGRGGRNKGGTSDDIPDGEFARIQARLEAKRNSKSKK